MCAAAAAPARAQFANDRPINAVLPSTGFGVQNGTLQQQLDRVPPGGGPSLEPGLRVDGSIGVDVGVTDNPGGLDGNANASGQRSNGNGIDGLAVLSPTVGVSGQTSRVRVSLGYAPTLTRYLQTTSQNRFDNNFFGSANVAVVPEAVYVDASASASTLSRTGNTFYGQQPGQSSNNVDRANLDQTYDFSVTPFVIHRFGGTGTAQVGATLSYTSQGSASGGDGAQSAFTGQAFGGRFARSQPLTTVREFASFVTGEDLGRINSATRLEATQFSGSGVYSGNAHRNTVANDLSYALTHSIALIGRIGYEDIQYSGIPPTRINDAIWRAGVRLTPAADSQITLGYGHQDGINSFYANGYYSPTARTRVTIVYSSGIETDLEDIQNTGVVSQYDPTGGAYDAQTGGPVSSSLSFSGIQNNLFKLRRASATGSLAYDRDTFALTITNEQRTIIAAANTLQVGLLGSSEDSTSGSLTWEHSLSPVLTSSTGASVGTNTFGGQGGGSQTTIGLTAALFYTLSPTVTTSARYNFQTRTGNQNGLLSNAFNRGFSNSSNGTENTFFLGLRKSF